MRKLPEAVVQVQMHFIHMYGNEKMERARGITNLIRELLRGVQDYTFGVSLTLEVAKIEIL